MVAQRVRHRAEVEIVDGDRSPVSHTPELITRLFDEELNRIIGELPPDADDSAAEMYREARRLSEEMIVSEEFDPV